MLSLKVGTFRQARTGGSGDVSDRAQVIMWLWELKEGTTDGNTHAPEGNARTHKGTYTH